ncbi:MAG: 3'-5' exonuclease, partial [Chloroflexota bacterium]
SLLHNWSLLAEDTSISDLLDLVIEEINYESYLRNGTREGEDRWENVMELRQGVKELDVSLGEFLEHVSLVSDIDDLPTETSAPTLMTLHAAKGLEFPVVMIVGLEEGILPHRRSWDSIEEMAEERRLFYVGITRAEDRVILTHCFRRAAWGDSDLARPSRFLEDIPAELLSSEGRTPVRKRTTASEWDWDQPVVRTVKKLPDPVQQSPAAATVNEPIDEYRSGEHVQHNRFGHGIVVETRPSAGDIIITIAFDKVGVKRLLGSMAKLTRIDKE